MLRIFIILFFFSVSIESFYAQKKRKKKSESALELTLASTFLMHNGLYLEAVKQLKEAIALDPSYPIAYYTLAYAQKEIEDLDGSLKSINKALMLDSADADYYWLKGRIYSKMEESQSAYICYKYAHKLKPQDKLYLKNLIFNQFLLTDYDKVLHYCDKLLELDTLNTTALSGKGYALLLIGDAANGYNFLNKSYELNSTLYITLVGLLEYCSRWCDLDEFYKAIERMEENYPDKAEVYFRKGVYFRKVENYNEAVSQFLIYNKKYPRDTRAYLNLGYCYRKIDEIEKSIEVLLAGSYLDPEDYVFYNELARSHLIMSDEDKAKKYVFKALQIDSLNTDNLVLAYYIYDFFGEEEKGISYLLKVLEVEPDNDYAIYNLGMYELYADNFEKALFYLLKYKDLKPEEAFPMFKLGTCFAKMGETDKACEFYTKALHLGYTRAEAFVDKFCYGK